MKPDMKSLRVIQRYYHIRRVTIEYLLSVNKIDSTTAESILIENNKRINAINALINYKG